MSKEANPEPLAVFTQEELEAAKLANNPEWKTRTDEVMRERLETTLDLGVLLDSEDPDEIAELRKRRPRYNSDMAGRMADEIDRLYQDGDPAKGAMMDELALRIDDSVKEQERPTDADLRHNMLEGGRGL